MTDPRILDGADPTTPARVAALIAVGAVVAIPTDTVYGVAVDPFRADAVARVYALKDRPRGMELSLLGAKVRDLAVHGRLDGLAAGLAAAFWPGALSLIVAVLPVAGRAAPAGDTVSLRVPAGEVPRALLEATGVLATTSANRHGAPAATSWEECVGLLEDGLDAVVAGPPAAGQGSTIIDCTEAPPRVLRAGPLSLEVLRPYLGG